MTPLHPETEVVATTYDSATGMCAYTVERDGRRWTARLHVSEFDKHKGNKQMRRQQLAAALQKAMQGPPDE